MRVAINAGHCPGLDSGACGKYSTEANVVRDVAKIVCEDLKLVGCETLFIQENELQDICDIANDFEADIFVSIHCNAFNHQAEGTETFYVPNSSFGYILSRCLQNQLITLVNSIDRGITPDSSLYNSGLYVLRHTIAPAALCELDFIDNEKREDYINDNIDELAHAIARGITDYFQEVEEWV